MDFLKSDSTTLDRTDRTDRCRSAFAILAICTEGAKFEKNRAGLGEVVRMDKDTFYYMDKVDLQSVRRARRRDLMCVWIWS